MDHVAVELHGATGVRGNLSVGGERRSVLGLYRSPSSDLDLDRFISDLALYCDTRPRGRTQWILGDINCCILPGARDLLSNNYLYVLYMSPDCRLY
jgi:hypothetical protein